MSNKKKTLTKSEERRLKAQKDDLFEELDKVKSAPLTGINYRNLPDDKVVITGFYGFLTFKEIGEQYGEDVLSVYEENTVKVMLQYEPDGEEILRTWEGDDYWDTYVGQILSDQEFSCLVATIKKCGSYLHDLKIAIKSQEKTIGI